MICGLDEAGRGPLAGPVTAGAAVLPPDFPVGLLNDSKKLSARKRERLYDLIRKEALACATVFISPEEIDRINILQASLKAMALAFEEIRRRLPHVGEWECLADGNRIPPVGVPCRAIVKGDTLVPEIMAASILAKVERDRYMCEMDKLYPAYGFARHKGYPTEAHRDACRRIGLSPIHRRSFRID
ncbi:MAG: ribonuclease HII [Spirochaetia bacterium]|nr:ribonuclease HII [Spirochaetia bacterium]